MDLEQGLKIELSTIKGLNNKVFPLSAPEGTAVPYLVYSLSGADRTDELTSGFAALVGGRYQLNIFHLNYGSLKAIMHSAVSSLKGLQNRNMAGSGPYVQQLTIEDEHEIYEPETRLYNGIIDIMVFYEE